jgi:hypothetical protein
MPNNPFGPMPIDDHEPASIVAKLAEKVAALSDSECDALLEKLLADAAAKRQMAGARVALESVLGLVVRVLF